MAYKIAIKCPLSEHFANSISFKIFKKTLAHNLSYRTQSLLDADILYN